MWESITAALKAELPLLIGIIVSGILGSLIGFERKARSKEAGIRTHTIVCVGAAIITVVSLNGFGPNADGARVAAQIVSGVGFLGAGIIVYRQSEVKGLTTAAGVWATAGVGMACGTEHYVLAIGATLIIILMQCLHHVNVPPFKQKRPYSINIRFQKEGENLRQIKELFGVDRFHKLTLERKEGKLWYTATLRLEKELSSTQLDQIMTHHLYIHQIERSDNI